jgi:hypothetical protein
MPLSNSFGVERTEADYNNLGARWINRQDALDAGIRRVDSITGCEMFRRKRGQCSGMIIPNILPGDDHQNADVPLVITARRIQVSGVVAFRRSAGRMRRGL